MCYCSACSKADPPIPSHLGVLLLGFTYTNFIDSRRNRHDYGKARLNQKNIYAREDTGNVRSAANLLLWTANYAHSRHAKRTQGDVKIVGRLHVQIASVNAGSMTRNTEYGGRLTKKRQKRDTGMKKEEKGVK